VGVQPHVLRYWETEFRSIRPQKSSKGQRVYSRRDVEKLLRVKDLLRNQGFTIAGARKRLSDAPDAALSSASTPSSSAAVSLAAVTPVAVTPVAPSLTGISVVVNAPAAVIAESASARISEHAASERVMLDSAVLDRAVSDRTAKDMRKALLGLRQELMRMLDQISTQARDSQ
jgi:DNA-binding transcriptional MerR regulator